MPQITPYLLRPKLTPAQKVLVLAAKVPVDELHPRARWVACLEEHSVLPSGRELAIIRSYIAFRMLGVPGFYHESYARKVLDARLPRLESGNSLVFLKGEDGWRYRWATDTALWSTTPRATLSELIATDLETISPENWAKWRSVPRA